MYPTIAFAYNNNNNNNSSDNLPITPSVCFHYEAPLKKAPSSVDFTGRPFVVSCRRHISHTRKHASVTNLTGRGEAFIKFFTSRSVNSYNREPKYCRLTETTAKIRAQYSCAIPTHRLTVVFPPPPGVRKQFFVIFSDSIYCAYHNYYDDDDNVYRTVYVIYLPVKFAAWLCKRITRPNTDGRISTGRSDRFLSRTKTRSERITW